MKKQTGLFTGVLFGVAGLLGAACGIGRVGASDGDVRLAIAQDRCAVSLKLSSLGGCYNNVGYSYGVDKVKYPASDPERCKAASKQAFDASRQACNTPEGLPADAYQVLTLPIYEAQ